MKVLQVGFEEGNVGGGERGSGPEERVVVGKEGEEEAEEEGCRWGEGWELARI